MGLHRLLLLSAQLLVNEGVKFGLLDVLKGVRPASARVEPMEDLLEGVLPSLLIGDVIAERRLLVELRKRVGSLLEAYFEAVQMYVSRIVICPGLLGHCWWPLT